MAARLWGFESPPEHQPNRKILIFPWNLSLPQGTPENYGKFHPVSARQAYDAWTFRKLKTLPPSGRIQPHSSAMP